MYIKLQNQHTIQLHFYQALRLEWFRGAVQQKKYKKNTIVFLPGPQVREGSWGRRPKTLRVSGFRLPGNVDKQRVYIYIYIHIYILYIYTIYIYTYIYTIYIYICIYIHTHTYTHV